MIFKTNSLAWDQQAARFLSIIDFAGDLRADFAGGTWSTAGGTALARKQIDSEATRAGQLLDPGGDDEARHRWWDRIRQEGLGYECEMPGMVAEIAPDGTVVRMIELGSIHDVVKHSALLCVRLQADVKENGNLRGLVHALADQQGITVEVWLKDHDLKRSSAFVCFSTRSAKKISATLRNKIETVILAEAKAAGLVAA